MSKKPASPKKSSQTLEATAKVKATTTPNFFSNLLSWFDRYGLLIIAGFLFAFIPLYPKLPLFDLIPGYIVRVRLEDFLILFATIIYGIQVLRKKAQWHTPFTWMVLAYAVVGLLSTLSGVFITKTIPFELIHVGKSMLHYFRYLEYFSLFFVAYSAIKSKKDLWVIAGTFAITVVAISVYGYGQKYYYWPVYSTMNREFSKGIRLVLTEHARVQSTFGGHYDLAGYLVVALPILLVLSFVNKNRFASLGFQIAYLMGLWLLIMSASRTSFVAFVLGTGICMLILAWHQQKYWQKAWWFVSRTFLVYLVVLYMFVAYGESIYERFMQSLAAYPQLNETYHEINDSRKKLMSGRFGAFITSLYSGIPEGKRPKDAMDVDNVPEPVIISSDTQPEPARPADVYEDIPDKLTVTTVDATGAATTTTVDVPRVFSECALKYGLSLCIRLDTLWPRALQGFYTNPILGTGYATLTKETVYQFTEADSTDNNFLRTLGETGLAGFITFYSLIIIALYWAAEVLRQSSDRIIRGLAIGFIGSTVGLLLNAAYIDVFAASKIALTYWALTGFLLALFVKEVPVTNLGLPKHVKKILK